MEVYFFHNGDLVINFFQNFIPKFVDEAHGKKTFNTSVMSTPQKNINRIRKITIYCKLNKNYYLN